MGRDSTFEEDVHGAVISAPSAAHALDAVVAAIEGEFAHSGALFYSFDPAGALVAHGGRLRPAFAGDLSWFEDDPCQDRSREILDTPLVHCSRALPRAEFVASTAYREFYGKHSIDHIVCMRLNAMKHSSPGMTGLFLGRGEASGDFTPEQKARLFALLPALGALQRTRWREDTVHRVLAGLAEAPEVTQVLLVLSGGGNVVWSSQQAHALLGALSAANLADLAALLRAAAEEMSGARAPARARAVGLGPSRDLWALQLSALAGGPEPLYLAVLEPARDAEAQLAARFHLTPTEAAVLGCLGEGMSNADIALALSISSGTAATHVKRILAKMGVRSRLQAALVMQRTQLASQGSGDGRR